MFNDLAIIISCEHNTQHFCGATYRRIFRIQDFVPTALYFGNMFSNETKLRVRYAETDRMGYVYYGVYAQYFEVGRVEALRSLGMSYRRMEEDGIMLPVRDLNATYHKPAFYDDLLTVRTTIVALPAVRIQFAYEVRNENGDLLTEALTTLVFIDRATNKPCRAPEDLLKLLAPFYG